MESTATLKRLCRHCGALLKNASMECWFCHKKLEYADIIRVEEKDVDCVEREETTEHDRLSDNHNSDSKTKDVQSEKHIDLGDLYFKGRFISGIIIFVVSWIYAVIHYGLFIGIGLGWIPSLVIAFIGSFIWPLLAVLLLLFLIALGIIVFFK